MKNGAVMLAAACTRDDSEARRRKGNIPATAFHKLSQQLVKSELQASCFMCLLEPREGFIIPLPRHA